MAPNGSSVPDILCRAKPEKMRFEENAFFFLIKDCTSCFPAIPTYHLFGRQVVLVLMLMRLLKGLIPRMAERGSQYENEELDQVMPQSYSW